MKTSLLIGSSVLLGAVLAYGYDDMDHHAQQMAQQEQAQPEAVRTAATHGYPVPCPVWLASLVVGPEKINQIAASLFGFGSSTKTASKE